MKDRCKKQDWKFEQGK